MIGAPQRVDSSDTPLRRKRERGRRPRRGRLFGPTTSGVGRLFGPTTSEEKEKSAPRKGSTLQTHRFGGERESGAPERADAKCAPIRGFGAAACRPSRLWVSIRRRLQRS